MAQRRQRGWSRRLTVEDVAPVAFAVALGVAGVRVVLSVLSAVLQGSPVFLVGILQSSLVGVVGDAAFLGAVLGVVVAGTGRDVLVRAAAVVYVGGVVEVVLDVVVGGLLSAGGVGLGLGLFVGPLFRVALLVGIAATLRLFRGETVLPGVDYRL
jgi:hypothetical protein